MKNEIILPVIIAVLVAGGLGFFGGMQYGQSKQPQFAQMMQGGAGQYGAPTRGQGAATGARTGMRGGGVVGSVVSIDNGTITVKLTDGTSKIVDVTKSTTYSKQDSASLTDLKVGDKVAAFGATNSDGSVTATLVQLNPASGAGMMRPAGGAQQTAPQQPVQ